MVFHVLWFASNSYLKGFSCLSRVRIFLTDYSFIAFTTNYCFISQPNLKNPLDIVSLPYESLCKVDEQLNTFMTPLPNELMFSHSLFVQLKHSLNRPHH